MSRKQAILDLELANVSFLNGVTVDELLALDRLSIVTVVHCVLLPDVLQVPLGDYHVNYNGKRIDIRIRELSSINEDPIINVGKNFQIGNLKLPFLKFTDNQGRYPARLVSCSFPYLLPEERTIDYEEASIVGPPIVPDKVKFIAVLRELCKDLHADCHISYEDVTAFLEYFFRPPDQEPLALWLHVLTTGDAYRNAVDQALNIRQALIYESFAALAAKHSGAQIANEKDLRDVVMSAINDVLMYHIEDRHWIDAFWDGSRTYHDGSKEVLIPRMPKHETAIQPTLHVILELSLSRLGIHVIRESDEGVGTLDFRCLYTTPSGTAISVGIEFKLAHHKELKKGINSQLPSYLRAIRSKQGIFAVMWFRSDKKIFNEPSKYAKSEMQEWLVDEAVAASAKHGIEIASVLIDASIRPSASKAN